MPGIPQALLSADRALVGMLSALCKTNLDDCRRGKCIRQDPYMKQHQHAAQQRNNRHRRSFSL
jgi:hypothetical protein